MFLDSNMFLGGYFSTILYCIVPLITVFTLKFHISELCSYNRSIRRTIAQRQDEIRALQAEWTYLNSPRRLKKLAMEVLGMRPTELNQMVDGHAASN